MKFKQFFESKAGFLPPETAAKVEKAIAKLGGKVWVVGGAVRDMINPDSPPSKDIDLLVTDLPTKSSEKALSTIIRALEPISKTVGLHGESFGVIKADVDGEDLDIALPRAKETKTGEGHSDFEVQLDPQASVEDDLARRDFTINAMASSLDGKQIVDRFGGREDMSNKLIRAVGNPADRFFEDPLRMIRALQFSARFGFQIEPETLAAMQKHSDKIKTVAGERVFEELLKGMAKGKGDVQTLANGFVESGLGEAFFGPEFDPVPVTSDASLPAKFIALFFNGGDVKKAKPTNEMMEYLRLAKEFSGTKFPFEFIRDTKQKEMLSDVRDFFDKAGDDKTASKIAKAMKTAIIPKDLVITGKDLMDAGLKGQEIGRIQREILQQVWLGKLNNTVDDLSQFIRGELSQ